MKKDCIETICHNRKARHEYHIIDSVECGIVLLGSEIKSIRSHNASLEGSYAVLDQGEIWLIDSNIQPYKMASNFPHDPKRKRKLLLKRQEIRKFGEKSDVKGYTLVPLKIYLKNGKAKIELAVCQGKQIHDKRQSEKAKEAEREMRKYQ